MRILILVHSLRRGGAERVCLELAAGLESRGHVVEVIAWLDVDEYPDSRYESVKRKYLMDNLDYKWLRSIPLSAKHLSSVIGDFKPDVVEIHTSSVKLLMANSSLKVPVIHVLHGYGEILESRSIKGKVGRMIARWANRRLDSQLVVVSMAMRASAARYYGVPEEEIDCIPNGVDLSSFRFKPCQPSHMSQILMVGTLSGNKGQLLGIRAFQLLQDIYPNAILCIVGEGLDRKLIEDMIQANDLSERVRLLGCRSDIPSLMSSSRILWHLSRTEAMPMVVLEAMASGLPVVGFDVPGVRDIVIESQTGYLKQYNDLKGIAEVTADLLSSRDQWKRFSRNSRVLAEETADLEIFLDLHESTFRRKAKTGNDM